MSLADDLKSDIENVFFSDFNDMAVIGSNEIAGFLDINAYQWADIDSSQHIFITVLPDQVQLQRDDELNIEGQLYKYVKTNRRGDLHHIVVSPR